MLFFVMACRTLDLLLCRCIDRVLAVMSGAIEIGTRTSTSGRKRLSPKVATIFRKGTADQIARRDCASVFRH